MGRTLETYRMLLENEQSLWKKQTKAGSYFLELQHLFDFAQNFADAATYWSSGLISEKIIFTILMSQFIEVEDLSTILREKT